MVIYFKKLLNKNVHLNLKKRIKFVIEKLFLTNRKKVTLKKRVHL